MENDSFDSFDRNVTYWTPGPDGLTFLSENPIQSPWKCQKSVKIDVFHVQKDTFLSVRFVGDILAVFGDFRVFTENLVIFLDFAGVLGKT